jgi:putative ABC transport system substrate-binding protein
MRRRDLILLAAGALAWPLAARAQRGERARRIAVMMTNAADDPEGVARVTAFRQGLREIGWVEGQNLQIDWHWSGGDVGRIHANAAEVAASAPDLAVANGSVNVSALIQVAGTIPIVFVLVNDPVGQKFVASLAHPGGNVTGYALTEPTMFGKSLELLKQLAPAVSRVGFLYNPDTSPYYAGYLPALQSAARAHGVAATEAHVRNETEMEAAVTALSAEPGGGLIVPPDTYTLTKRGPIIRAARDHKVPAIYAYRQIAREGGLLAYGPDTADIFWRSASYVDRILKGASPADLPVQAPAKFELAINMATASALGLTVPPTLSALADEVIE